jgi:hypothetical protein
MQISVICVYGPYAGCFLSGPSACSLRRLPISGHGDDDLAARVALLYGAQGLGDLG